MEAANQCNWGMREKSWDERTDAEKLEALRQQVVFLSSMLFESRDMIEHLQRHEHSATSGALLFPVNALGGPQFNRPRGIPFSLRKSTDERY